MYETNILTPAINATVLADTKNDAKVGDQIKVRMIVK